MMPTNGDEEVVALDLGITWEPGAPLPVLIRSEHRVFLAFRAYVEDPNWDGTYVTLAEPADPAPQRIGIIAWRGCRATYLGSPNDEAIAGHRLWGRGLETVPAYGAALVQRSAWLAAMERANRVHRRHSPALFEGLNHYILLFHGSTFECIARGYTVEEVVQPMAAVVADLAQRLVAPS